MNTADTLKLALDKLTADEAALLAELTRVRSAREAIRRAISGSVRAPFGGLQDAILGVLSRTPMSNSEIRAALTKSGYSHSLDMRHVSKNLAALLRARKVRRTGKMGDAKYVKV